MQRPSSAVKPERAVDALAVLHRAQAGAAAEMRDDHAAAGDLRRDLRQDRRDVLVRQAVEAVALHAARGRDRAAAARPRRPPAGRDGSWCRSRRPAARRAAARTTASMAARLCGWCSGASGISSRRSSSTSGVTIVGRRSARRHARRDGRRRARARRRSARAASSASASKAPRPSRTAGVQRARRRGACPSPSFAEKRGDVPMPSIWPRDLEPPGGASGRR